MKSAQTTELPTTNGRVPASLAYSNLIREALRQAVENLIDRYLRNFRLQVSAHGLTLAVAFYPTGTTISLTYSEPPCLSQDPDTSKDQTTVTETQG